MSRLLVPAAETRFPADRFAPTQHDSAAAKARFANHYIRFVAAGFDALQHWLWSVGALDVLAARLAAEREARERGELHRLLATYGVPAEFRRIALPVIRRVRRPSP